MRFTALLVVLFTLSLARVASAQEKRGNQNLHLFYEEQAKADAKYEQSLSMKNEDDEKDFWKDQQRFEKDLRKVDREAYRIYMNGKKNAYVEHAEHCADFCHHSDLYYDQANYYYLYHEYHSPERSTTSRSGFQITSPRIGLGTS